MSKQTGVSTGGVETSARYRRKQAKRRREEAATWAAQNGDVVLVKFGDTEIVFRADVAKRDMKAALAKIRAAIASGEPIPEGAGYSVRPGT